MKTMRTMSKQKKNHSKSENISLSNNSISIEAPRRKVIFRKNNRALRILANLLRRKLDEIESKKIWEEQEGKNASQLLISMIEKLNQQDKKKIEEGDVNNIVLLLKQIPGFQTFIRYNQLDDNPLKIAISHIKLLKVPPNTYIFRQGATTRQFFGIINGRISIRIRKPSYETTLKMIMRNKMISEIKALNLKFDDPEIAAREDNMTLREHNSSKILTKLRNSVDQESNLPNPSTFSTVSVTSKKNESETNLANKILSRKPKKLYSTKRLLLNTQERALLDLEHEEELLQMGEGHCFGEWGLIYDIPRTASAMTLEDTILFCIEKEVFDKSLSKGLLKAEAERKKYILQKIPAFSVMPSVKFDEFYRRIVAVFYKSKEIIYSENDKANYFYLLYQGTCKLQKNFIQNQKYESRIIDMKLATIMNIEKGDITGLEGITGSSNYNFNLVATSENTVLFKIDLTQISSDIRSIIKSQLIELQKRKNEILNSILSKQTFIKKKMKVEYRSLSRSIQQRSVKSVHDVKPEDIEENEKKAIELLRVIRSNRNSVEANRPKANIKLCPINDDFNNDNIQLNPQLNNSLFLNKSHVSHKVMPKVSKNSLNFDRLEELSQQINKSKMLEHIKNLKFQKIKIDTISTHNSTNFHNEVSHQNNSNYRSRYASFSSSHSQLFNINNDLNELLNGGYEFDNEKKKKNSIFRRREKNRHLNTTSIKKTILEEEFKKRQVEVEAKKIQNKLFNEMLENPLKNNKKLLKTVFTWKKTVNNKKDPFNSGSFNLPLYVLKNQKLV